MLSLEEVLDIRKGFGALQHVRHFSFATGRRKHVEHPRCHAHDGAQWDTVSSVVVLRLHLLAGAPGILLAVFPCSRRHLQVATSSTVHRNPGALSGASSKGQ